MPRGALLESGHKRTRGWPYSNLCLCVPPTMSARRADRRFFMVDQPSPLVMHLGQSMTFTPAEAAALASLERETVSVPKHTMLVQEGAPYVQAYIVKSGWLARHHSLSDGRQQILDFVIPGDLPGLEGSVLAVADHGVTALQDAQVAPFSFETLHHVVREHPRLAIAMIWSGANEKAAMGQRLTSLGRRSAYEATAHLIMAIRTRLKQRGLVSDDKSFEIPLTQRDLADALGLSVVHINRVLRRLDEDAVMTKTNRTVTIYDIDRLSEIAFAEFPE